MMFVTKWNTDEELWRTALTLTKERHYLDAFSVIKAIAVQTVQTIGGKLTFPSLLTPETKTLDETEILYMKALSKQISEYVEKRDSDQVAELTTEYLGRFVHLLADTPKEAEELHRKLLKSLIESKLDRGRDSVIIYKSSSPLRRFESNVLVERDTHMEEAKNDFYTTSKAAEIGGVSDQTIRCWCEKGKFPDAYQTEGGHWRIPQKYF
jgi:excisionase family DNA binding protein